MLTERLLVLAAADAPALGAVRALPGLRAAPDAAGRLWLRGLPATGELALALRQLPALAAYGLDALGRLFEPGHRTPTATLPALPWQPLPQLLPLELPTAALPAQEPPRYRLRLVPTADIRPAAALLLPLPVVAAYAATAPEVRLRPLRFAAAADGRTLLLGTPLPPLPGQEYYQQAALLLPAGYALEAPLLAPLLSRQLAPEHDALLLLAPDGSWQRVPTAQLLPATRASLRRTASTLAR